ncbi:MAG: HIT domain-containing protein [Thermoanaerobaculia bacterium]|nr:HIT domain-containing protein [Thermoanaerobaculia bacterium]
MTCSLCDLAGAGETVFTNEFASVLIHPDWAVPGHAMVVASRHVENASDLTTAEWLGFAETARKAERVLLDETRADRAILLKLGIQTPHLHLHIYPVSASLDRAAVMAVIEARASVARDASLVEHVRARMNA